jgi:type I restriction enzyme S subunit
MRFVPLAEVALPKGLIGGPFGSSLGRKDYVASGIPVIRGQNLGGPNRFSLGDLVFVTEAKAASELARNLAAPGDVIFTQRGTLGQVGVVPAGPYLTYVISQSQMRLRVDPGKADAAYVYYCFRDARMQETIRSHAITTGVPHINLGVLAELRIPLPPLSEQRAIAEVLGVLDDKIEVNERVAIGCDEFASAELGNVLRTGEDEGTTDMVRLGDVAGVNLRIVKPGAGVLSYLDISSVGVGRAEQPARMTWAQAPSRARRGVVEGDVLWSTVRPNRRSHCLLLNPAPDLVASTGFAVLTPSSVGPSFLYGVTERPEFVDYLVSVAEGSAYPAVRAERFTEAPIPLPEARLLARYESSTMPLRERAAAALRESNVLVRLRDALLPKLLSGELQLRDAKSFVKETV